MSWQLAAFALLAAGLAAGFAWYERERPDARIVALVGTLAAFAALGRIAFAALPNVKPTTDIVLISGYALGGGPGFAVGALAGLTSNFFFGQGPWTPWQMAAWGATGVLGAALAGLVVWVRRIRGRGTPGVPEVSPIGRWPLAIVCGAAGFAFTVVQDVGDWFTYSDHSATQLGVYVGKGLGFDAVHAAGCVGFALAFGPALIRSVGRFARRLQVTWVDPGIAAALAVGVLALGFPAGAGTAAGAVAAGDTSAPVAYLRGAENADGGFGAAPGQPSAALFSGWAGLGLASAGYDLQTVGRGAHRLMASIAASSAVSDVGALERTILVVRAAGLSPRRFAGHDLVAALRLRIRHDGSVSDQVNLTSFAILALRAARVAPPPRTVAWLDRQQDGDGGFSFAGAGGSSDVDDTGAVLEALAGESGPATAVRDRAVVYLRRQQNRDGGFSSQPGQGSNAQSTAWALQGLDAAHVDPGTLHRRGAPSPVSYLRSLIAPDGHIRYARGADQTPVWVTAEALMALEGKPLPLAAPPAALRPSSPPAPAAAPSTPGAPRTVAPRPEAPARGGAPTPSLRRRAARHRVGPVRVTRSPTVAPMAAFARGADLATTLMLAPLRLPW